MKTLTITFSIALALSVTPLTPALADDGVLEINQTCAVQTGCFPGDTPGFPVTIDGSAGRSYRLSGDLTIADANNDGIRVDADSISIDLNGFSIIGPGTCSGSPNVCTLTSGNRSFRAVALPEISPPPPQLTRTWPGTTPSSLHCSAISSPTVPCPAMMLSWS